MEGTEEARDPTPAPDLLHSRAGLFACRNDESAYKATVCLYILSCEGCHALFEFWYVKGDGTGVPTQHPLALISVWKLPFARKPLTWLGLTSEWFSF